MEGVKSIDCDLKFPMFNHLSNRCIHDIVVVYIYVYIIICIDKAQLQHKQKVITHTEEKTNIRGMNMFSI